LVAEEEDIGSFTGNKIHYGDGKKLKRLPYSDDPQHAIEYADRKPEVASQWFNRRPLCPYGCGEEGQLKEIIVTPGKGAVGIYRDSVGLIFTAPMKMRPKPSTKSIAIGPDGEPMMVDATT
jgi:hypothetical protein